MVLECPVPSAQVKGLSRDRRGALLEMELRMYSGIALAILVYRLSVNGNIGPNI